MKKSVIIGLVLALVLVGVVVMLILPKQPEMGTEPPVKAEEAEKMDIKRTWPEREAYIQNVRSAMARIEGMTDKQWEEVRPAVLSNMDRSKYKAGMQKSLERAEKMTDEQWEKFHMAVAKQRANRNKQ